MSTTLAIVSTRNGATTVPCATRDGGVAGADMAWATAVTTDRGADMAWATAVTTDRGAATAWATELASTDHIHTGAKQINN